ncbi:uncharacterized protein LOC128721146 [Anopheles nili]|uniref:uncharacterized protein LOC128721146 n=1 Tax=Anopheles nili TaxID=185578 RepID=UPI00237B6012|nr:uncharacterized protein LOC128721146 [Anopheles nili]
MQQQLNEISVIPMQIQATLSFLTQTLTKFAPPELQQQLPEALRATSAQGQAQDVHGADIVIHVEPSGEEEPLGDDEQQEEDAITLKSLFDESVVLDTVPVRDEDDADAQSDEEDEEPEISEEERSRIEKVERIIKLQQTWPWSQKEKPIHKRSNCHLVPSVALERSKIKQLTNLESLPFYKHGYLTRV